MCTPAFVCVACCFGLNKNLLKKHNCTSSLNSLLSCALKFFSSVTDRFMWCFVAECGEAHARASALHDETGTAPLPPMFTVPSACRLQSSCVSHSLFSCVKPTKTVKSMALIIIHYFRIRNKILVIILTRLHIQH